MKDTYPNCNQKEFYLETYTQWLIDHNKCPVCQDKLIIPVDVRSVSPETGQNKVEMKTVMWPIEMIASSNINGIITPIRFRINDTGGGVVVTVDSILTRTEEEVAGICSVIFRCRNLIDGVQKVFELKYEIERCKWFLYRV